MGNSRPPKSAKLDLVFSYARSRGDQAELVLVESSREFSDSAILELRRGKEIHAAGCELVTDERGRRVVARFDRADLTDGIYRLRLRTGEGEEAESVRLGARLLVQGRRPLVLLWGAVAQKSSVPTRPGINHFPPKAERQPRPAAPAAPAQPASWATARRVVDRLPDPLAARVRAVGRRLVARG